MNAGPRGGVVFGALSPHPPVIVPEVGGEQLRRAAPTVAAVQRLASRLVAARPRTVVIVGPHGPVARHGFVALGGPVLTGDLFEFGAPEVRLEMRTDQELLELLRRTASAAGLAVLDLKPACAPSSASSDEMDYATLVPLYYLRQAGYDGSLLVLSMAYTDLGTCYRFGQALGAAAAGHSRPVAVIASGDLSHRLRRGAPAGYNPRGQEFDRRVMEALAAGDPQPLLDLDPELQEAAGECGLRPLLIMLGAVEGRGLRPEVLSYEGPFGVGYGVAVFDAGPSRPGLPGRPGQPNYDPARPSDSPGPQPVSPPASPPASHHPLAQLARRAIETYVHCRQVIAAPDHPLAAGLPPAAGAFVSLYRQGELRGCIGTIEPARPTLNEEVVRNAIAAASQDPRFDPLSGPELEGLEVSVDVLGAPEPVTDPPAQLDPKRYGVIVARGRRRGLLLPDLEGVDTVGEQLRVAARKAGLELSDPGVRLQRFRVDRYR